MTDYRDSTSLRAFADRIQALSVHHKIVLAAYVIDKGLMLPRGIAARILWAYIKFGSWNKSRFRFTLDVLIRLKTRVSISIVEQTIDWMLNGKDVYDHRSAGGFNSDEIAMLEKVISNMELSYA